jgi:dTDP-4-amino-4,6-dideoxygalactose transaminase
MHTFGHPVEIDTIVDICNKYYIPVIEDSAEWLGSFYKGKHVGLFGRIGVLSFNGNKPVTTGGGGMIITNDDRFAEKIRHIITTAKIKHPWEFFHDDVGYNLRMPNINAAVGCGQMEKFGFIMEKKRDLAKLYNEFFTSRSLNFFSEPMNSRSNYWLNSIILEDRNERDGFLEYTNKNGIQTRPIWTLMNKLPMYNNCMCMDLTNSIWFEDRIVNIPSSVRI